MSSILLTAEMLSDSVYNYATSRRATTDQDSDSQFDSQSQLQLHSSSMQKPRNKRKNFKPISSRMAEVSDESERDEEEQSEEATIDEANSNDVVEYERKTLLLPNDERTKQQRLNNNEASPMDLSVATRPPSSEGDDDSGDSMRHKFILEQLRSQKLYSPGAEVSQIFISSKFQKKNFYLKCQFFFSTLYLALYDKNKNLDSNKIFI